MLRNLLIRNLATSTFGRPKTRRYGQDRKSKTANRSILHLPWPTLDRSRMATVSRNLARSSPQNQCAKIGGSYSIWKSFIKHYQKYERRKVECGEKLTALTCWHWWSAKNWTFFALFRTEDGAQPDSPCLRPSRYGKCPHMSSTVVGTSYLTLAFTKIKTFKTYTTKKCDTMSAILRRKCDLVKEIAVTVCACSLRTAHMLKSRSKLWNIRVYTVGPDHHLYHWLLTNVLKRLTTRFRAEKTGTITANLQNGQTWHA